MTSRQQLPHAVDAALSAPNLCVLVQKRERPRPAASVPPPAVAHTRAHVSRGRTHVDRVGCYEAARGTCRKATAGRDKSQRFPSAPQDDEHHAHDEPADDAERDSDRPARLLLLRLVSGWFLPRRKRRRVRRRGRRARVGTRRRRRARRAWRGLRRLHAAIRPAHAACSGRGASQDDSQHLAYTSPAHILSLLGEMRLPFVSRDQSIAGHRQCAHAPGCCPSFSEDAHLPVGSRSVRSAKAQTPFESCIVKRQTRRKAGARHGRTRQKEKTRRSRRRARTREGRERAVRGIAAAGRVELLCEREGRAGHRRLCLASPRMLACCLVGGRRLRAVWRAAAARLRQGPQDEARQDAPDSSCRCHRLTGSLPPPRQPWQSSPGVATGK